MVCMNCESWRGGGLHVNCESCWEGLGGSTMDLTKGVCLAVFGNCCHEVHAALRR